MKKPGSLYIVATPIGHPDDITLRALNILRAVPTVICEERRIGSTLLKKLGIEGKTIVELNEHNELDRAGELMLRLHQGEDMALISDCGTPVFADPGARLIEQVAETGLAVVPIPGASSLMAAMSILDFKLERFVFGGFLPRDPAQRRAELTRLRALHMPIVLMDAPYRLTVLLQDVAQVFGKELPVTLACDLTLPGERIYRGPLSQVLQQTNGKKAEFILFLQTR